MLTMQNGTIVAEKSHVKALRQRQSDNRVVKNGWWLDASFDISVNCPQSDANTISDGVSG